MKSVVAATSFTFRQHQKLAPLKTLAAAGSAADVSRDIRPKIHHRFDNNCLGYKFRYLSSEKIYRSEDVVDPKTSKSDVKGFNDGSSFYGRSNFQHMLQYQIIQNHTRNPKKKQMRPKKQDQSSDVHKNTQTIRHRQQSNKEKRQAKVYERRDMHEKTAASMERTNSATNKRKDASKVASSNWILISNTPLMSKLSDIITGIENIIAFEMEKGIIDLEKINDYVGSGVNQKQQRENLYKVGALRSFYATEQVDATSGIPLWTPDRTPDDGEELPSHMIMEARLHLSQHARPMGWFLRLPSRSIVHAILQHNKKAEKLDNLERRRLRVEEDNVKNERRKWRQKLWKGVWSEHENITASRDKKKLLDEENKNEWNLAWGVETDERLNVAASEKEISGNENETHAFVGDDGENTEEVEETRSVNDDHEIAFDYLDEFSQSNPYPGQFKSQGDSSSSGYRLLKCGSSKLKIKEFVPQPNGYKPPSFKHGNMWAYASFHMSPMLKLSDSVVRIETESLNMNVDDIQYMFRGYDLESVLPLDESAQSSLPSSCSNYVKSLGWNCNSIGNVNMLISGIAKSANPRHTFLVRFASPSSARMAIRNENGRRQKDGDVLSMMQFPNLNVIR
ncbi:hypothetical protein ACHAWC_011058 [Mediolabrus comicus]